MVDMFGFPSLSADEKTYRRKVLESALKPVQNAKRRQADKKSPAPVDLTRQQVMALLEHQKNRCALTREKFWTDDSDRFGPLMPSLDRIAHDGPYSIDNVRIVLIGVNSSRGRGSDEDMYRIPRALIANAPADRNRDRSS